MTCFECGGTLESPSHACPYCGVLHAVPESVVHRALAFVGRHDTVLHIDQWLATDAAANPVLVVVGGPGSGKSALMAWLCGAGPPPTDPMLVDARERIRSRIAAAHFCVATSAATGSALDPMKYAATLARELSYTVPGYGERLVESSAHSVEINVRLEAGSVGVQTGVVVNQLNAKDPASVFTAVLDPLSTLDLPDRILLLVDALDEGELWPASPTIGELLAGALDSSEVREKLRLLVSTRPVDAVTDRFPPESQWDLVKDAGDNDVDVAEYTKARLEASDATATPVLVAAIAEASDGNFLYAKTTLDYWIPKLHELEPGEVPDLPPKLDGIYSSFLQREYGSKDGKRYWNESSKPLLGALGVAQDRLDNGQLRFILDAPAMDDVDQALERCAPYLDGERPDGPFDVYHQSFREFLFDGSRNRAFPLSLADANARTARRYMDRCGAAWEQCFDEYGLRHTPIHLAEAARHSAQPDRHDLVEALVRLVGDEEFRQAHDRRLRDPASLQEDLRRAVEEACLNDAYGALGLVLDATREWTTFRDRQADASLVFQAAQAGDLEGAERLLGVFQPGRGWHRTALLVAAWLAADRSKASAQALVDRLSGDPIDEEPLGILGYRVGEALADDPADTLSMDLEPWDDPSAIRGILGRMSGTGGEDGSYEGIINIQEHTVNEELISQLGLERGGGTSYLGGIDGPILVGFTLTDAEEGERAVVEYTRLLASNGYIFYRNRSLRAFLFHVLRHPLQDWARKHARSVCEAALAGSGIRFREGLPIVRRALEQHHGLGDMALSFDERADQAAIDATRGADDSRGERGDTCGEHKRRLGMFAEASALVFDDRAKGQALLDVALGLRYGFAGFESPACLALAQSALIVAPDPSERVLLALGKAAESAHCVQDPAFCARTTSRFNAMERLWRSWLDAPMQADDLAGMVERFVARPFEAEFSAIHRVGEAYHGRKGPPIHLEIPAWAREAATLRELARFYEQPVGDFLRLNARQGWGPDDRLDMDTYVAVPDPGMTPLVSTFLSAQVVAVDGMDDRRRAGLIQSLVHTTLLSDSGLDTLLARLLLVAKPDDPELLSRLPTELERSSSAFAAESTVDLTGQSRDQDDPGRFTRARPRPRRG